MVDKLYCRINESLVEIRGGNVATRLFNAFLQRGLDASQLEPRNRETAAQWPSI
jgi:hypothetical protein